MSMADQGFNPDGRKAFKVKSVFINSNYEGDLYEDRYFVEDFSSADLISSEVFREDKKKMHKPALDIDMPVKVVPSSTLGHFHLYIDKEMTWRQYRNLLRALKNAGIIEKGYYKASVGRKATFLRTPWFKKDQ